MCCTFLGISIHGRGVKQAVLLLRYNIWGVLFVRDGISMPRLVLSACQKLGARKRPGRLLVVLHMRHNYHITSCLCSLAVLSFHETQLRQEQCMQLVKGFTGS